MLDDSMPGAVLEAPDTFQRLAAPLWPRLPLALGYSEGARWVAFYLALDTVTYNDGASSGTGDTGLFLAFKRHPVVAPHLAGAQLGSAETEASDWLVIDRQEQALYLAAQEAARWHLVAQWPRFHRQPLEYTQEELGRLLDNLKEAISPPDWPAKLAEALRESRANERLMLAWLDARHEASKHDR
jgi:hypothetical protein